MGGRLNLLVEVVNSKEENPFFCPNYVQEFGLSYFTSPFAIAKRLEMRLSVSPAAPFLDASLANHTKMFELVHVVTSIDDFLGKGGSRFLEWCPHPPPQINTTVRVQVFHILWIARQV